MSASSWRAIWRSIAGCLFATFAYIDGGVANDPANGVFAGNRFRLQPDTTASGGATLRVPVGTSATFYATPSATYRSKVFFELPNRDAISQGGYTLVNLRGAVRPFADKDVTVFAEAHNLTDEEAREHTSFLKDIAPLPGRNLRIGVSYAF